MEDVLDFIISLIILTIFSWFVFSKKRSDFAKGQSDVKVYVKDNEVNCSHCGYNRFDKREGLLNTTWISLFRLNAFNQSSRCFVCKNCGFTQWFTGIQEKIEKSH